MPPRQAVRECGPVCVCVPVCVCISVCVCVIGLVLRCVWLAAALRLRCIKAISWNYFLIIFLDFCQLVVVLVVVVCLRHTLHYRTMRICRQWRLRWRRRRWLPRLSSPQPWHLQVCPPPRPLSLSPYPCFCSLFPLLLSPFLALFCGRVRSGSAFADVHSKTRREINFMLHTAWAAGRSRGEGIFN